jgi:CubicO group peptidase (beta-lactamase class C family)
MTARRLAALALFALARIASAQEESFQDYARRAMREWNVPGIAIAIVRDGKVVEVAGHGVRDVRSGGAIDGDTRFPVGSVTKTATAAGVAKLVLEEKLKWDDGLAERVPGLVFATDALTKELTVRDALSHRSGLPTSNNTLLRSVPPAELARRMRFVEPAAPLRTQFTYNNQLYVMAGILTEKLAGQPWPRFITEGFFVPLGMSRTDFRPVGEGSNEAAGHAVVGGEVRYVEADSTASYAPAGAMVSSARDLGQWLLAFAGSGSVDGKPVLPAAAIRAMHAPAIHLPIGAATERMFPSTHFSAYGMGWFLRDYRGFKVVEHGGNVTGYSTQLALLPEKNAAIAIVANLNNTNLPRALMFRFIDSVAGGEPRDWSAVFLEQTRAGDAARAKARAERPETTALPRDRAQAVAGRYAHPLYGDVEVRADGERTVAVFNAKTDGTLLAGKDGKLFVRWSSALADEAIGYTPVTFTEPGQLAFEGIGSFRRREPPPCSARVPAATWEPVANRAGWSAETLDAAKAFAKQIGTMSWMLVQDGRVVDQYGPVETLNSLHSARKSVASALFGIAAHEGKISLDDTLAKLGIDDENPPLDHAEKQATVRDLLMARSGVYHPALGESPQMKSGRPARGSHAPGTFWYYNNWDFNALGTILERATSQPIFEYFGRRIAAPLQMQDFKVPDQESVPGPDSQHRYYDFRMSTRDLARFGHLFLRQGCWNAKQVIPAEWVTESTTAYSNTVSPVFPQGMGYYGYMWWVAKGDRFLPNAHLPEGSYAALGVGPQIILVIPSRNLVFVHRTNTTDPASKLVPMGRVGTLIDMVLSAQAPPP